jgi:hypothetical protein
VCCVSHLAILVVLLTAHVLLTHARTPLHPRLACPHSRSRLTMHPPTAVQPHLQAAESMDTMQELNVMELLVLKVWRWNVCVVTPAHFIPFYARVARVYDTVEARPTVPVAQPEQGCVDVVLTDPVTQLACSIAEGASLDATAMQYQPSVLAAAAVAVARMQCGVSPHWPHTLSALAGFPASDDAPPIILACCGHLLGLCRFGERTPEVEPSSAFRQDVPKVRWNLDPPQQCNTT